MRILFLTNPHEDYLADSLLHGLRSLLGNEVVDYPKCEQLYDNFSKPSQRELYGRGFTLYTGLLPDIQIDRFDIFDKLRNNFFDWVVIGSVWHQSPVLQEIANQFKTTKVAILDGADSPRCYPFAGKWMRSSLSWILRGTNRRMPYFKRECTDDSTLGLVETFTPHCLRKFLINRVRPVPVAFSFPAEKVAIGVVEKTKLFPKHIVDVELLSHIPSAVSSYAFRDEDEYYRDLRASKFGITTKKGGWDCMRHYEIAANMAVPCFRDLDNKPETCAPHGLDRSNCLVYTDWLDLKSQIDNLTSNQFIELQSGAKSWILNNTTLERASQFVLELNSND